MQTLQTIFSTLIASLYDVFIWFSSLFSTTMADLASNGILGRYINPFNGIEHAITNPLNGDFMSWIVDKLSYLVPNFYNTPLLTVLLFLAFFTVGFIVIKSIFA